MSRSGKMVALSFALLSVLAMFWKSDPVTVLTQVLAPFGVLAGLVTAAIVFLLVSVGLREEGAGYQFALTAAALAMVWMGALLGYDNVWWIGWMLLALAMLLYSIVSWLRRERPEDPLPPPVPPPAPAPTPTPTP
ncbi:hypothetical protein COV94_03100, partial [Candidatus Woesearchaeota archaeon CG11_big_fil_rev_8_21_14_0_20_57_5]